MSGVLSSPFTQAGVAVVVLVSGWLTVQLTRSPKLLLLVAVPAAYAGRRVGLETGFLKWVDHEVLARVSGEFDDFGTWLVALLTALAVLVGARLLEQHGARDEP